MSTLTWATVTAIAPLRIQLDGDPAPLVITPASLVDPAALAVSDRVRVELADNNRLVVLGRYGGAPPLLATNAQTAAGLLADRAVTPAGLKAVTDPIGVRLAAGWEPVVLAAAPTSTGSTATLDASGKIVTAPAGCTSLLFSGCLQVGYDYMLVSLEQDSFTTFNNNMNLRFYAAATQFTGANHNTAARWQQYDGTSGLYTSAGTDRLLIGIGYTGGGEVRREVIIMGAAESTRNTVMRLWNYTLGAARETAGGGSVNVSNAFDGFRVYNDSGSFAGTFRLYRRVALV